MLNQRELALVEDILHSEKALDFVKAMIYGYAGQRVENAKFLLDCITNVTDTALRMKEIESKKLHAAGVLLINCMGNPGMDKHALFALMTPICFALFPNGYPRNGSKYEQDYFNRFISLLMDKEAFSWKKDKTWADLYKYTEYLQAMMYAYGGGIDAE